MFLRHTTVRRGAKTHVYWNLVRSIRVGGKVRQEVVASLGRLDARGPMRAQQLADKLTGRRCEPSLFEPDDIDDGETAEIELRKLRVERSRRIGDVYLALVLWRALQLDQLFDELIEEGREDVRWSTLAAIHVILRLCSPSSDLALAEDVYRKTALEDLLGVPAEKVNDDRVCRALDKLLPHKPAVEQHLRERLGELFAIDYDLLLYDVTSTYFEGLAESNPQAKRGYSRDHRPDCRQVCIALVVTREGIPLSYEVFDGNTVDVTTVEKIVTTIEARFGSADRVWVMDRGMVSEKNVAWLRGGGRRYLIGASKSELGRMQQRIVEDADWMRIREDVEVKLVPREGGDETFLLCRSEQRKAKDRAIVERFGARLKEALDRLSARLERSRKTVDRAQVERQIGRMLERNSRVADKYEIVVEESAVRASGLRLVVRENESWVARSRALEGCYLLRTNVTNWTEAELWQTYIQLTQAEAAFRVQKSDLQIRPVWHRNEERVQAHIFICFLADVLWKTLEQWTRRAGLGDTARTVLDELAQVQSVDVVLPTTDARELRIRCVVKPEPPQAMLLERLGVRLPRRLNARRSEVSARV
ncbi:MAG: IS1634 family transposase [Planctomycetes bacterium]|nr:IS1634 family transposase [Planctomycetota bacterium]